MSSIPREELLRALSVCQPQALRYQDLALATRRMLRALDGYWDVYETNAEAMETWWTVYERWRKRVEELAAQPSTNGRRRAP